MRDLTDREALHIALELMSDHEVEEFEKVAERLQAGHWPTIEEWEHCIDGDIEMLRAGGGNEDPLGEEEQEEEGGQGWHEHEEEEPDDDLADGMNLGTPGEADQIFTVGQRVKVVYLIDDVGNRKYLGQIGTVTHAYGRCTGVETMPRVQFADGASDAFWPEELEPVPDRPEPSA